MQPAGATLSSLIGQSGRESGWKGETKGAPRYKEREGSVRNGEG